MAIYDIVVPKDNQLRRIKEHVDFTFIYDELKEKAKSRYKIEAKNSEIKHRHGYETANSAGLFGMQIQGATAILAVNLKRIITLLKVKE